MMTEDLVALEADFRKMSYLEICHKMFYLDNQPVVKMIGRPVNQEQQAIIREYVRQMIATSGLEKQSYLGTGSFEMCSRTILDSDDFFTIDQYKDMLKSNAFISEGSDISVVRLHRYFDVTEIHESVNISFVLSGVLETTIANKPFSLKEGSIAVLSPNIMHRIFITDDDTVILTLMIRGSSFTKNFHGILESGSSCAEFFVKMLHDRESTPFSVTTPPYDEYLKDLLIRIMAIQYGQSDFKNLMIRNLAEDFLLHLFSHYQDSMVIYDNNVKANELVYNILGYLYEHFSSVTLEDVARKFSYSTKHISRVLFQVLGKKYQELITEIRLNKAQELLINTDLGMEDICQLLGYSNPRHLRYLFGNAFGISPSAYRNIYSVSDKQE